MACPPEFVFNCYYAFVQCHICRAGEGSKDLKYKPIAPTPALDSHPEYTPLNRAKAREGRQNNKVGRKVEARVSKAIGARHNISSQGFDSQLEALQLKIEVKCRVSPKSTPWPTKEEWGKAMMTGIDIFIITDPSHDKQARVCMPLETLKALLEAVDKAPK
jgi:hypothetical protein